MSAKDERSTTKIEQLELEIGLPISFKQDVDEYEKKLNDIAMNLKSLPALDKDGKPVAVDQSEYDVQRRAMELLSEYRQNEKDSKTEAREQRKAAKASKERFGIEPDLTEGRLSKTPDDRTLSEHQKEIRKEERMREKERKQEESDLRNQAGRIGQVSSLAQTSPTPAGILSQALPFLGPAGIAITSGLAIVQLGDYVISELQKPGGVLDTRFILRLVEQTISDRFRSLDQLLAIRAGRINIISTQQQGFVPFDESQTTSTIQQVAQKGIIQRYNTLATGATR